jgi:hypothetical protein
MTLSQLFAREETFPKPSPRESPEPRKLSVLKFTLRGNHDSFSLGGEG